MNTDKPEIEENVEIAPQPGPLEQEMVSYLRHELSEIARFQEKIDTAKTNLKREMYTKKLKKKKAEVSSVMELIAGNLKTND